MGANGPASSTPASSSSSSVTAGGGGTAQKPWLFVELGNPGRMYNLMGLSAIDEERWMLEVLAANVSILLGSALLLMAATTGWYWSSLWYARWMCGPCSEDPSSMNFFVLLLASNPKTFFPGEY